MPELRIVRTISSSTAIADAAGLTVPAVGDVVSYRDGVGVDSLGAHFAVDTLGGLRTDRVRLTVPHRAGTVERRLRVIADVHRGVEAPGGPDPHTCGGLAAVPAWRGVVLDDADRECPVLVGADLAARGMRSLDRLLTCGWAGYLRLTLLDRLTLGYRLALSMHALATLSFVHGSLGARCILVAPHRGMAFVSDVDTGVVARSGADVPVTVGVPDGFLAPEIVDEFGAHRELASQTADWWSLAVALHVLLLGCHPFWMLPDEAPATVRACLGTDAWPGTGAESTADEPHLEVGTEDDFGAYYRRQWNALPRPVRALLRRAVVEGWREPQRRPAPAEWVSAFLTSLGDPHSCGAPTLPRIRFVDLPWAPLQRASGRLRSPAGRVHVPADPALTGVPSGARPVFPTLQVVRAQTHLDLSADGSPRSRPRFTPGAAGLRTAGSPADRAGRPAPAFPRVGRLFAIARAAGRRSRSAGAVGDGSRCAGAVGPGSRSAGMVDDPPRRAGSVEDEDGMS
jgi:hypothetical protein